MACDKGQIPYNGKCYSPADFQKVLNQATGIATNQGGTKSSTPSVSNDKQDTKAGGFDWVAVLSILASAAPAVISASKGNNSGTGNNNAYNSAYNNTGDDSPRTQNDESKLPIWVWGIIGVVIAVVIYLIFSKRKQ